MNAPKRSFSEQDLSPDQREVFRSMIGWSGQGGALMKIAARSRFDDEQSNGTILTVGGYAGTGKTTVLGVFASQYRGLAAYVTYTGRASSILRRKLDEAGVATTRLLQRGDDERRGGDGYYADEEEERLLRLNPSRPLCSTIHRLLYRPIVDQETGELLGWAKRDKLDRRYDLIVVDEASMVSDEILEDINQHGVSVLAVGDHGQLPPVMARGDLMKKPQLRLEKIHRQAEKSPIISLSRHIREGGYIGDFDYRGPEFEVQGRNSATQLIRDALRASASPLDTAVLCWTNRQRVKLNQVARQAAGFRGPPRKGEPVICLKNRPPIYNGMRGILVEDSRLDDTRPWLLHALIEFPEEGIPPIAYELCAAQFNREKTFSEVDELRERGIDVHSMTAAGDFYDFGYCCTVHKFQGSQAQRIVFYVDRPEKPHDEDWRRFAYTAVTRASEYLGVIR